MGGRGAFLKIRIQAGFKKPVWYCIDMNKYIDETENYYIMDVTHLHCDEVQFKYVCKVCGETMDCYYCTFDAYGPHGCDTL